MGEDQWPCSQEAEEDRRRRPKPVVGQGKPFWAPGGGLPAAAVLLHQGHQADGAFAVQKHK